MGTNTTLYKKKEVKDTFASNFIASFSNKYKNNDAVWNHPHMSYICANIEELNKKEKNNRINNKTFIFEYQYIFNKAVIFLEYKFKLPPYHF